ncbi:hypothetical protein IW261DRAFT_1424587 [Armillaria novae-zelandiae]|uniref:Uncharacterized protein n=1 Tax=Armillaria novae-zelandiae TaxID=153914 RepID=A0AA39TWQ9_9AGAR|nr:hypothetical protein IW261DRAFT_1424587 [Armillaria novae-zelandiae]
MFRPPVPGSQSGPSDSLPQPAWSQSLSQRRLPLPALSSGSEYTSITTKDEHSKRSSNGPNAHHESTAQGYQFGTPNLLSFLGTQLPYTIPTILPNPFSSRKRAPSSGRRSVMTGATTTPAPSPAWRKEKTPPPVEEAVAPIPAPQPSYPAAPPFIPVVLTPTSSMLRGTLAPMLGYTGALAGSLQDKGKQKEDRQSDVEVPYGELQTRARKLIQYQEWFLQGHTGVAYHDYREAGEYDYAQYIIDTKAEQHTAIQWNIYHPEQPVQVPAGWAPTMEPLRQTLPAQSMPPPFKMCGAKAKPGFTGRPFGGADNGAPGPAPADPDDPHPWGPVINLPADTLSTCSHLDFVILQQYYRGSIRH